MNARPTLILPVQPDGQIQLLSVDGKLVPFDPSPQTKQSFDIILPGQIVRIYSHELPKMREREKIAAAKFAIEDRTAAPLDGQHIALASSGDNRLAVIDSSELSRILSQLQTQGIDALDIYADFDWIAPRSEAVVLPDRIIFTSAEGYTIDPDWADSDLADLPLSGWDNLPTHDGKLSLRQGAFARVSEFNLPFTALAKMAALIAFTGLSWLTLQWAETRATVKQAEDLKQQTAALYTQATGQPAPANPALAVTRAVKSGPATDAHFIPLLAGVNSALLETNNINIQSLSYDQSKAQLNLKLIYPSFESASELEQAVSRTGGSFRTGGVREQNGILIGDATFEVGAAP